MHRILGDLLLLSIGSGPSESLYEVAAADGHRLAIVVSMPVSFLGASVLIL